MNDQLFILSAQSRSLDSGARASVALGGSHYREVSLTDRVQTENGSTWWQRSFTNLGLISLFDAVTASQDDKALGLIATGTLLGNFSKSLNWSIKRLLLLLRARRDVCHGPTLHSPLVGLLWLPLN